MGAAVVLVGFTVGAQVGDKDIVGEFVSPTLVGRTEGAAEGTTVGVQDAGATTAFTELTTVHVFVS